MTHARLWLLLAGFLVSGCSCPAPACVSDGDCTDGVCRADGTCGEGPGPGVDAGPTGEIGDPCDDGDDCGSGHCYANLCAACAGGEGCESEEVCIDGSCVEVGDCTPQTLCGQGGDCCPGEAACLDGQCRAPCDTVRCGPALEQCCGAGDICYAQSCVSTDVECVLQSDCEDDEVCEPDLGICIPEALIGTCEYVPPPGLFEPEVDCRWTNQGITVTPNRNDIVMAPVVGNLTDDNGDGSTDRFDVPEVVFLTYDYEGDGCCNQPGTLRVVSGACNPDGSMTTLASITEPPMDNSGGLALGDLDGDGVMEIVAITMNGGQTQGTVAFKRASDDGSSWTELWHNETYPTWNVHTRGGTQPALTDLTGDGVPEVIVGNVVLNGLTGDLVFDGVVTSGGAGGIGNNAFLGPVSSAADLDLDGEMEVLAGNTAYGIDGMPKWTYPYTTQGSGCGGDLPCDGYTSAANFDDDPQGEVAVVRRGEVFFFEHDGQLLDRVPIPVDNCANNESGPPTVADFDGDGRAEVGTAAGDFYVVVDLDCQDPLPAECLDVGVLWAVPNEDCSSRVTASSVFDFEGDGAAEVVYADETSFRILRGTDGQELYRDDTHGSHTRLEMAVIADVDNDGNAEVVIAENAYQGGTPGVEIWADALDNWVFTRRIWNQHAYHVTNITEDGTVTGPTLRNWEQAPLNNFRQNTQGEGVFWAPDLIVSEVRGGCFIDELVVRFNVKNQGSRQVGPGVNIAVFNDADTPPTLLGVAQTTVGLLPGAQESFELTYTLSEGASLAVRVVVDDDGTGQGQHNECLEDNNEGGFTGACINGGG